MNLSSLCSSSGRHDVAWRLAQWARTARRFRSMTIPTLWPALAAVALAGCVGAEERARRSHERQYEEARRIEPDPVGEAASLRASAGLLEREPMVVFNTVRAAGLAMNDDIRTSPTAFVAEWRARAAAMEADPVLSVLTMRRAADAVAARFEPNDRPWPWPNGHPCRREPRGCPPKPPPERVTLRQTGFGWSRSCCRGWRPDAAASRP